MTEKNNFRQPENHNPPNDNRTPMVLLPYQQRWIADPAYVKVCEKSRRIGLSWGEAADSALLAAQTSGMNVWYIGYNKDMALEFIHDCGNWAKFYGWRQMKWKRRKKCLPMATTSRRCWRL